MTQAGTSDGGSQEWNTYGSVTGPVEVCVESATVTPPPPDLNFRYATWALTATISIRFAGHVLQTFTNVAKVHGQDWGGCMIPRISGLCCSAAITVLD